MEANDILSLGKLSILIAGDVIKFEEEFDAWILAFVRTYGAVFELDEAALHALLDFCESQIQSLKLMVVTKHPSQEGEWTFVLPVDEDLRRETVRLFQQQHSRSQLAVSFFRPLLRGFVEAKAYDARVRCVLRDLCAFLHVPWQRVLDLERQLAFENSSFLETNANEEVHSSGRFWKVMLAAVGGGAVMVTASSFFAPSAIASMLALCQTSTSLSQLASLASQLMLTYGLDGGTAISGLVTVAGASLGGVKMGKRTEGIREFHFAHLISSGPADKNVALVEKEEEEEQEQQEEQEEQQDRKAEELLEQAWRRNPLNEGLPVYILVSGWFEQGEDTRGEWGGVYFSSDGTDDPQATTAIAPSNDLLSESWVVPYNNEGESSFGKAELPNETSKEEENEEDVLWAPSSSSTSSSSPFRNMGWFREFFPSGEAYLLLWERERLSEWADKARKLIPWEACARMVVEEVIKQTSLQALFASINWPLALLEKAEYIDNIWMMAREKAFSAGELLGRLLLERPHGTRPVTLVGYSYGAKLIFHCLEFLARQPDGSGRGIVENVVLMGCPVAASEAVWREVRSVVSGRLVNVFSSRDWFLILLFRLHNWWEVSIAGIQPVEKEGVEDVDVSHLLSNHFQYPNQLVTILPLLGLELPVDDPDMLRSVAESVREEEEESSAAFSSTSEEEVEEVLGGGRLQEWVLHHQLSDEESVFFDPTETASLG